MKNHAFALLASVLLLSSTVAGCGIGIIYFEAENGGPPKGANPSFTSYDIDCTDTFVATGGMTVMNKVAGDYTISCSKDGQPFSAEILGKFHAAPAAAGKWDTYRAKVIKTAQKKGCPAVAVRKTEPSKNQQGEAIGAFCVKS